MLYQYNGMTNGMYCFTCVDDSAMLGDVAGTASFNYMVGDFQYDATKPQLNKGDVVSVELLKRPRVTKRLEWDPSIGSSTARMPIGPSSNKRETEVAHDRLRDECIRP